MKLLYCMLGLSMAACTPQKTVNGGEDELSMLIGTYTDGTSKGIYSFRFNQKTGTATPLDSVELSNPSYLTPSEDGKFIYAVSEMNDSTAAVNALAFDKQTGNLRLLNSERTPGAAPCYVSTNGKEVLTANYSGGNMSVFRLRKDGTLSPAEALFKGTANGPDTIRQIVPHIHCALFSPDGKYIFATDFSADRILRFTLSSEGNISRLPGEAIDIAPDSGPRHLTFSPNGKFAYLINELSGKVIAFGYTDGKLEQIQSIAASPGKCGHPFKSRRQIPLCQQSPGRRRYSHLRGRYRKRNINPCGIPVYRHPSAPFQYHAQRQIPAGGLQRQQCHPSIRTRHRKRIAKRHTARYSYR